MTLTVTRNGRWRLVGEVGGFAALIGLGEGMDSGDVKSNLASLVEGTTIKFKDHHSWWELKGSRADLAEFIGYPEAKTVAETVEVFESMYPDVRVLS